MKKGLTELVFIVDRSGSMSGLEKDTIGGFNSMLREQQAQPGQALVTTILFDDIVSLLHDRLDIQSVAPLTEKDYTVGGCTALLDAVGMAMHRIRKNQERDREEDRPEKTLFVIITDGLENSSRHYTYEMIRERVARQKKLGWEFLFFGANMDAIAQASDIGIDADMAQNYVPSARGTSAAWSSMSAASSAVRAGRRPVFGGSGTTRGSGSGETDSAGLTGSADTVDSQDIEEAMLSVKGKLSALVGSFHEFYDVVNELRESADANGGKVPDVNEILRSVLEDREKEEKE